MRFFHFFIASITIALYSVLLVECGSDQSSAERLNNVDTMMVSAMSENIDERFSITGDFNGDMISDTIFESYISSLTNKEISKAADTTDWENNIDLVIKRKPITRLYSSIAGIDTFAVTTDFQQAGVSSFSNLGDLNGDKSDEFGYTINWTDYSNLNTFHIVTIKNKKFNELFSFTINESVNFEPENLIEGKFLVRSLKPENPKKIEYRFYSDTASVETGYYTFN
jgi:hypothetical protein